MANMRMYAEYLIQRHIKDLTASVVCVAVWCLLLMPISGARVHSKWGLALCTYNRLHGHFPIGKQREDSAQKKDDVPPRRVLSTGRDILSFN